jgi:pimeloyl-ACP methyl ester carboxylesterase
VPELTITPSGAETASSRKEAPLFFASAGRPLYGAYHPADTTVSRDGVLVFCHSIGIEHMVTQRMEALGARAAAKTGFAAFRYNARAHGDSAGDPQAVTFGDLVDDACAAADYARKLSGASRVIWVGVRFGCLVAAAAMARRNDTAALALWEPLHRGEDYFRMAIRTLLFCLVSQGKRPGSTVDDLIKRIELEGVLPIVGTYVYYPLYRTAREADLALSLQNWSGDTLIAQVQRRSTLSVNNDRLRLELEQCRGKVAVALISQEPAWNMLPLVRPQWTSDSLLAATKEWLHGLE